MEQERVVKALRIEEGMRTGKNGEGTWNKGRMEQERVVKALGIKEEWKRKECFRYLE